MLCYSHMEREASVATHSLGTVCLRLMTLKLVHRRRPQSPPSQWHTSSNRATPLNSATLYMGKAFRHMSLWGSNLLKPPHISTHVYMCMCVHITLCMCAHVDRGQRTTMGSVPTYLAFLCGLWRLNSGSLLGRQTLYWLSHVFSPLNFFN